MERERERDLRKKDEHDSIYDCKGKILNIHILKE